MCGLLWLVMMASSLHGCTDWKVSIHGRLSCETGCPLTVTGWAQIITVKGVLLLTPKSVNEMMNTKAQCYWETPSQPCGRWRWESNGEGRKQEWNSGNFPLTNQHSRWLVKVPIWWHQSLLASHHFLPPSSSSSHDFSPSSRPPTGLTWCLLQCWDLVFNILFTDFGVSNNTPLTMIICAQPVTLELGLRTMPFGYLCSADWAQSYSVSLDPLASLKYPLCHLLGK